MHINKAGDKEFPPAAFLVVNQRNEACFLPLHDANVENSEELLD